MKAASDSKKIKEKKKKKRNKKNTFSLPQFSPTKEKKIS
jgi:hypothetical protein